VPLVTRGYAVWGDAHLMIVPAIVSGLLAFQMRIQRTRVQLAWAAGFMALVATAAAGLYMYYLAQARIDLDPAMWLASPPLWVLAMVMVCYTALAQLVTVGVGIKVVMDHRAGAATTAGSNSNVRYAPAHARGDASDSNADDDADDADDDDEEKGMLHHAAGDR
jgi:hypothetical protein